MQDIDGRFGVLSVFLREKHIYTAQEFMSEAKRAFNGSVDVIPVAAIFDYKRFYDPYVPDELVVKKLEHTMLGWRIERLTAEERLANPDMMVKTNYTKAAQGLSIDLREIDPLYDPRAVGEFAIYSPIVRISCWIPCEAKYERAIGFSYLTEMPTGAPQAMMCAPWSADYHKFMKSMQKKFSRQWGNDISVIRDWQRFLVDYMPTKTNPDTLEGGVLPSDDVLDYVAKFGSKFFLPLGRYLYSTKSVGFGSLHDPQRVHVRSQPHTPTTSFHGLHAGKMTLVDRLMTEVVEQEVETIPRKGRVDPLRRVSFHFPEMLQGVVVHIKGVGENAVYKTGQIIAFTTDTINHGPTFTVRLFQSPICVRLPHTLDRRS